MMVLFYLGDVFLISELMCAGSVLQMPSMVSEQVCGRQVFLTSCNQLPGAQTVNLWEAQVFYTEPAQTQDSEILPVSCLCQYICYKHQCMW